MGGESKRNIPVILLLENDTADVFMFRRSLGRLGYHGYVYTVSGVTEAKSYLERTGAYRNPAHSPRPDLIVCDYKLFASTGTELLQWIRTQEYYRDIPVVMLSGSALPQDEVRAHELGARAFFVKSGEISEMTERVGAILQHLPADGN